LIEVVGKSPINEFILETQELKLSLKKSHQNQIPCSKNQKEKHLKKITSPLVGKVEKILVQEGEKVEKGKIICILKMLGIGDEIKMPEDGLIKKIEVKKGQKIEYGQVIFDYQPLG